MAIGIAVFIALIGAALARIFTKGKSKKRKYIIWGIANIIAIGPFLSFAIGLTYAIIERNGWAGMLMFILYPFIFIFGLTQIIIGIFMKTSSDKHIAKYN